MVCVCVCVRVCFVFDRGGVLREGESERQPQSRLQIQALAKADDAEEWGFRV